MCRIDVTFLDQRIKRLLWDSAKANPSNTIPTATVTQVEPYRNILVDELTDAVMSGITQAIAQLALAAMEYSAVPEKTLLDQL